MIPFKKKNLVSASKFDEKVLKLENLATNFKFKDRDFDNNPSKIKK